MSKFLERWEEENKKFVLPQGTDDLKKLTAVVESLIIDKLVSLIDAEFESIHGEEQKVRETLDAILKQLVKLDEALKPKGEKITIPAGVIK